MNTQSILRGMLAALALIAAPLAAGAAYPEKPVRLIVPFAPGGNIDASARSVSKGLSDLLGQTVVVENRAGAGGIVGSEYVARAAPDGYVSLLASTGALAALSALYPDLPFDPAKDFEAVGSISRSPLVLVVGPRVSATTLEELIAHAKANPGKLTMASAGTGTSNHLAGELFQSMSGTRFLHVPYKGSGQALADLLGGQVDIMFDQITSSLPHIQAGRLRALGVTTASRSAVMPELPTLAESGLAGFEASTTTGIMFPAGTSRDIVEKFDAALRQVLQQEETRRSFLSLGAEALPGNAQEFGDIMAAEVRKWSRVVKDSDIKIDK